VEVVARENKDHTPEAFQQWINRGLQALGPWSFHAGKNWWRKVDLSTLRSRDKDLVLEGDNRPKRSLGTTHRTYLSVLEIQIKNVLIAVISVIVNYIVHLSKGWQSGFFGHHQRLDDRVHLVHISTSPHQPHADSSDQHRDHSNSI